ncbi:hypothetical protein QE152_g6710 [Popillia japonica]|uniref:Uncharacterized protein n=1 Tax=Popillia japonica TaxID=7064 RepID=A0AAW1MEE0_POPJA
MTAMPWEELEHGWHWNPIDSERALEEGDSPRGDSHWNPIDSERALEEGDSPRGDSQDIANLISLED